MESHLSIVLMLVCLVALTNGQITKVGCGSSKACFHEPEGCDPATGACDFFASYNENTDNTKEDFEIVAKRTNGQGWIGVGFSKDKSMGDDSGVMCINDGTNAFAYKTFHNNGQVNVPADASGLSDTSNSVENGIMSCSFTRVKSVVGNSEFFDLAKNYYLMMGSGPCVSGTCAEHEKLPYVSSAQVNFTSTDDIMGASGVDSSEEAHDGAANDLPSRISVMVAVMVITVALRLF